jgi:hypothetical protein
MYWVNYSIPAKTALVGTSSHITRLIDESSCINLSRNSAEGIALSSHGSRCWSTRAEASIGRSRTCKIDRVICGVSEGRERPRLHPAAATAHAVLVAPAPILNSYQTWTNTGSGGSAAVLEQVQVWTESGTRFDPCTILPASPPDATPI